LVGKAHPFLGQGLLQLFLRSFFFKENAKHCR
jgi:hypothetical protein